MLRQLIHCLVDKTGIVAEFLFISQNIITLVFVMATEVRISTYLINILVPPRHVQHQFGSVYLPGFLLVEPVKAYDGFSSTLVRLK